VVFAGASAATERVKLTVDGRPLSAKPDVALSRGGAVYANVVELTRAFGGFLTFQPHGVVKVTMRGTNFTFAPGKGGAFEWSGDLYVPLSAITGAKTGITMQRLSAHRADLHVAVFGPSGTTPSAPASAGSLSPAMALAILPSANVAQDGLHVSVAVKNTQDKPYTLNFPTSARAAFVVDKDGVTVWDSSRGKRYLQSLSPVTLAPGETVTYSDVWTGWSAAGPGRYQLRARLMTATPVVSSPVSLGVVSGAGSS
jgi:hypothetical protein